VYCKGNLPHQSMTSARKPGWNSSVKSQTGLKKAASAAFFKPVVYLSSLHAELGDFLHSGRQGAHELIGDRTGRLSHIIDRDTLPPKYYRASHPRILDFA
jgi:hypothetical protein